MFFNLYSSGIGKDDERQAILCFLFQLRMHFQENKDSDIVNAINLYVQNFHFACKIYNDNKIGSKDGFEKIPDFPNIKSECRNFLKLQYNDCDNYFEGPRPRQWDYKGLSPKEANWAIAFLKKEKKLLKKFRK